MRGGTRHDPRPRETRLLRPVVRIAARLRTGLQKGFDRYHSGVIVFGEGPMWHSLFADRAPEIYRDPRSDNKKLIRFDGIIDLGHGTR